MIRLCFRASFTLRVRLFLLVVFLLLVGLSAGPLTAWAEEKGGETKAVDQDADADDQKLTVTEDDPYKDHITGPPPKWMGKYGRWIKHAEMMALSGELDMWGASATVPEGFLLGFFGYGSMRAAKRFDNHRKLINIIPVFNIPDPFHLGGDFFELNFNASGTMKGYGTGLTYGLTDRLMVGFSTFWAVVDIKMDPIFIPGTCERLGVATRAEFYSLLEELGRPRPKHYNKSDPVDWGDSDIFVNWNYYRGRLFSSGFTTHFYLPTAHRAEADKAIIFALGPDLDTGNSAWGLGLDKVFDFRPPAPANIVTFSLTLSGALYFQTKRESPKFLKPNRDVWDYMKSQGVELDFFPDLSDIDDYYYYTPPPWVAVTAGIGISLLSVSYRHGWGFEGKYETNSPGFKRVIDEIGLVGNGDDGKVIIAANLPLTPIYFPGLFQFQTEIMTDGRNAMVFRDSFRLGVGFAIPIAPPEKYALKD